MRRLGALVIGMLLIFGMVGTFYPVKGESNCTPEHPCYITQCTRVEGGYYIVANDIVVESIDQLVPVNFDNEGNYAGLSCIAIYGIGTIIEGNGKRIVLKIPMEERPSKVLSAVYIESVETNAELEEIRNLVIDGWDVGIDPTGIGGLDYSAEALMNPSSGLVYPNHYITLWTYREPKTNVLIYNNTIRNTIVGIALSGGISSYPSGLPGYENPYLGPYLPRFSGIVGNTFENNAFSIFLADLWAFSNETIPFLVANNTVRRSYMGIYIGASVPAVNESSYYSSLSLVDGPTLMNNRIVDNIQGITIVASKRVELLNNTVKNNHFGLVVTGEKNFSNVLGTDSGVFGSSDKDVLPDYWTGVVSNVTISGNEITNNTWGLKVSMAENLTISNNLIADNRDTYEEIPYTLPDGREITAYYIQGRPLPLLSLEGGENEVYYVSSPPLYGIGLYLHNVSNSIIENNELYGNGIGPLPPAPLGDGLHDFLLFQNYGYRGYLGAVIDVEGENNTLRNNYIHDNAGIGIYLRSKDRLEGNVLVNDYLSTAGDDGYFTDFEVKDTTVNGKPIVMAKNRENVVIGEASQVFVVRSRGVRIEGLDFQGAKATPMVISDSSEVEVTGIKVREIDGVAGIYVQNSTGVRITESSFEKNHYASIGIRDSREISVEGNTFAGNFGVPILAKGIEDFSVMNNEISSSGGGMAILDAKRGKITGNRINKAVRKKKFLFLEGKYLYSLFLVEPIFDACYPQLPGIQPRYSVDAAMVVNGSDIVVGNNEISGNEMAGVHVWNGKNVDITNNRIANNSLGGLLLGVSNSIGKDIRVEKVTVRGNTFINNGLSIIGRYESTFIDRLLIPKVPLVKDISIEDNTVNGKPLVYLENQEGMEINDAGQIIAINSSFTIKNLDVPFTDLPLLAIDSRVNIENSRFEGRWGAAVLRSNASIKNTRVEHGAEWVQYSYYDPRVDGTVNETALVSSFGFHLMYSNATLLNVEVAGSGGSGGTQTGIDFYAESTTVYPPVSVSISGAKVRNELIGIDVNTRDAEIRYSTVEDSQAGINIKTYGKAILEGNRINNATWGLYISSNSEVTVASNTIHNVKEAGIRLGGEYHLRNFNVTGNEVKDSKYGLWVMVNYYDIEHGAISNNVLANNLYGLVLNAPYDIKDVEVHTNWLVNNNYGLTISARKSEGVLIYNNYFDNGRDIYVSSSLEGVYFNTTLRPGRNIVGGPFIAGNYWEKYYGVDNNFDGIGDEPYRISYGIYDYLPLVKFEPKSLNKTFPIIINEPGYYRLETDGENLSMEYAVLINASNVLLDGANHTLSGKDWALYGVKVENAENVTVVNLNLKGWLLAGIYAENTANARISGNTVTGNTAEGIDVRNSRGAEVSYNTIKNLTGDGVYLEDTVNSSVFHNTVENTKGSGVELDTGALENFIGENSISSSGTGVYLRPGSGSNTIFSNWLINNSLGVYISGSSFNLIYNNYLDNARNVKVLGDVINHWNVTKRQGMNILGGNFLGGNYWSELKDCEDKNLDGFCDVPYIIDDSNVDYLPLTISADTTPPKVEIVFPENATYSQNVTEIRVKATDDHMVSEVKALVDGSIWVTMEFDGEYYTAEINLGEGHHIVEAYAYDVAGNVNSTRVEFTVEIKEIKTSIKDQETAQTSFAVLTYLYYLWYQRAFEEFNALYNSFAKNLDNETLTRINDLLALAEEEYRWVEEHCPNLTAADVRSFIHMRKAYLYIKRALELLEVP